MQKKTSRNSTQVEIFIFEKFFQVYKSREWVMELAWSDEYFFRVIWEVQQSLHKKKLFSKCLKNYH